MVEAAVAEVCGVLLSAVDDAAVVGDGEESGVELGAVVDGAAEVGDEVGVAEVLADAAVPIGTF